MYPERKLNSKAGRNETLFWMIVGPALIVLVFLFGLGVIFLAPVCLVYCLFSFLLYLRTFNPGYLVKSMMFFFLTVFFILAFFSGLDIVSLFMGGVSLLFLILLLILIAVRDYKWRTTELLELAAWPVNDVKEGYTMRPMPAGKLEYKWDELQQFASFIKRNLVSVVYHEKDKVVFSLNRSRLKLISFSSDYIRDSWISFDHSGQVSVHISKEDYKLYKDNYAFDQLCNSLGSLYSEFFLMFQQKKESNILKQIDLIRA